MDTHSIIAAHYATRDRRISEDQFYREHSSETLVHLRIATRNLITKLLAMADAFRTRGTRGVVRRKLEA